MFTYPAGHEQPESSPSLRTRLEPPSRVLFAGAWSAEIIGDELAHISFAGRQVLRAVKGVVRDQDWQTAQPSAHDLKVTRADNALQARWTVEYAGHAVKYQGELTAIFTPESLRINFNGVAAQAFRSNRIGLVVLHPTSDAGRDIAVKHTDGSCTVAQFPDAISPHQPFMDISALEWADADTSYRLSFKGDVFETEDQRNWTDASFKTYSTPLARPFPVNIAAGDTVRHSVLLEAIVLKPQEAMEFTVAKGQGGLAFRAPGTSARITGEVGRVPALGTGTGLNPELLPIIPGLEAMVVELIERPGKARRTDWDAQLRAAANAAARQGAGLDIRAVTANPVNAVDDFAKYLPYAERLAVFHPDSHVTESDSWQQLRALVRTAGYKGSLLAGARSHFTELNRQSGRIPSDADAITFSITPQMHSTELAHMIESVPMQRLVAQNALRLGGGRPLHVGPITLLPRFNAVATTGLAKHPEADELQFHPFTAAWVLASINALTIGGVASVSYFEASGPNGIADSAGQLSPAGELLKELASLRDSGVLSIDPVTGPATVYPVQSFSGLTLFAGNLSGSETSLDIQLPDGASPSWSSCAVFGQGNGSSIDFLAGGGAGQSHGRLMLGPWSAGVVRFPITS